MIPAWTLAMMDTGRWSPLDLGAKLKAWWAPPHAGNTTLVSGAVSSWRDEVAAYNLTQATAAQRPAYNATSFSGLACCEFDGSNDNLFLDPVPAALPVSNTPGEMWVSCRQDTPATDTADRMVVDYGASTVTTTRRTLYRGQVSGANRVGAGAGGVASHNTSAAFLGRHVVRGAFSATSVQCDLDGAAGPTQTTTVATLSARLRVGGATFSTTAGLWKGAIRQVLVTAPLTSGEAAALTAYLTVP